MMWIVVAAVFVGALPFVAAALCTLLVEEGTGVGFPDTRFDRPVAASYQPMVQLTKRAVKA